jgi:hypothetical protein
MLPILFLVANTGAINRHYKHECVEELSESFESNYYNLIHIPKRYDAIREIFIVINLPILEDGMYWKDNLLTLLFDSIEIDIIFGQKGKSKIVLLDKTYIQKLIREDLKLLSDKLLFRDIPCEKRKKMSRKEISLTMPLKISNFISQPSEIFYHHMSTYDISLKLHFQTENLVENNPEFILEDFDFDIKVLGVIYPVETIEKMIHSHCLKDQVILETPSINFTNLTQEFKEITIQI